MYSFELKKEYKEEEKADDIITNFVLDWHSVEEIKEFYKIADSRVYDLDIKFHR